MDGKQSRCGIVLVGMLHFYWLPPPNEVVFGVATRDAVTNSSRCVSRDKTIRIGIAIFKGFCVFGVVLRDIPGIPVVLDGIAGSDNLGPRQKRLVEPVLAQQPRDSTLETAITQSLLASGSGETPASHPKEYSFHKYAPRPACARPRLLCFTAR